MFPSLSAALLVPACLLMQALASPPTRVGTIPKRYDDAKRAEPIPPLQDSWYIAPDGLEDTRPGTVLRLREAPGNLTSLVANCSAAYNILYRTTNSRYRPDWAVTTVFVPTTKAPALLSYQFPYDSAFLDASPSYVLYSDDSITLQNDIKLWSVIWLVCQRSGLRRPFGELQVQYAPEMNFSGAALGGLTPNITSVMLTINRSPETGLVPVEISGPYNATGFLAALNYTANEAFVAYANQDIGLGGIGDLFGPVPTRVTNLDGIMGYHGVPQMPLLVYKAITDEVSVINDTDALVERYCNVNANILYRRNTVVDHSSEFLNGRPVALAWLSSVLGDMYSQNYSTTGCTTEVVTVNITSSPVGRRSIGGVGLWSWTGRHQKSNASLQHLGSR